ncbi:MULTISPECIES: hypothetical protein [unclassified Saccharicrinis]|uniref:hypothetical protein n=1 Tax=unclassified Saccharicrinis TaxID=2646859 RepID=UPI003D32A0C8
MRNQKNITDRKQLKTFFKKGNLPGEKSFEKLIDSTFNIADDKLDINEDGLMIYPSENVMKKGERKLLSFFEDSDNNEATWVLSITKDKNGGMSIQQITPSREEDEKDDTQIKENTGSPAIFIQKNDGKVGIGKKLPRQQLDVNGIIASEGRMGTHMENWVEADGEWHNVFDTEKGLNGCHAFEITAYAKGDSETESLIHAIAVCTRGNSRPKITKTAAYYGKWWNKIDIRWESRPSRIEEKKADDTKKLLDIAKWWKYLWGFLEQRNKDKYNLQIKTRSNYGQNKKLHFRVSVLWNSNFINDH